MKKILMDAACLFLLTFGLSNSAFAGPLEVTLGETTTSSVDLAVQSHTISPGNAKTGDIVVDTFEIANNSDSNRRNIDLIVKYSGWVDPAPGAQYTSSTGRDLDYICIVKHTPLYPTGLICNLCSLRAHEVVSIKLPVVISGAHLAEYPFGPVSCPGGPQIFSLARPGMTSEVSIRSTSNTDPNTSNDISAAAACVCAASTCAAKAKNCGSISDGCGGTLECGTCLMGQSCVDNVCQIKKFMITPRSLIRP